MSQEESPQAARRPAGAATGVGSMPGVDVREAARVVLGEVPDLPHLVELPARGAGADLLGRTLALLPGFAAETVPTGWALTARPGPDTRRARAWLAEDLDVAEELAGSHDGEFKVSLAGPATLAAGVELASGERVLRDHGAVRDLTASLAEAVTVHVAEVRRRLPRVQLLLQLDEPLLPAALAARVPTASGFGTLRRLDVAVAESMLRTVIDAAVSAGAGPLVHSCAAEVPITLLRRVGARAVSVDLSLLRPDGPTDDALGECVEAGVALFLGVVPTSGTARSSAFPLSDVAGTVLPVQKLWQRLGFDPAQMASSVVLTPACGLAGSSPQQARAALAHARAAATLLAQEPEPS